jgi:hypothetical protein
MSSVPPDVLDRLRKIAGLLGSEHAGERAAAAAKANEILARYRITWADVVDGTAAGNTSFTSGAPPRPEPEPDWQDVDDGVVPIDIPDDDFSDRQLRACAARAISEHQQKMYDLGDTDFLEDVSPLSYWTPKQRIGLVKSLRRAWVIRKKAGYR